MRTFITPILILAGLAAPQFSKASSIFTGSATAADGQSLSAEADFSFGGTLSAPTLTLTLINTATVELDTTANLLTAVFFDISGGQAATLASAIATETIDSSNVVQGTNVDASGAWNVSNAPGVYGGNMGVGSVGLGVPGFKGGCCAWNIAGSAGVNGSDAGFKTKNGPWADHQITFVFDLASGTDPSKISISDVTFQYGTALTDTSFSGNVNSPEPGTFLTFGFASILLAGFSVRRLRAGR